eukprot:jgi/Ulvmu1/11577/UM079_0020.1
MKLDANALRYLSRDDWRVLTAVELGQKNHEIVPAPLIESIAKLKHGGVFQSLSTCLKHKLLHHDGSNYDGYRLTTLGYDFLAIHTLTMRGLITSVGRQIGVGKESDLYEVAAEDGTVMALKLHRLGRTSFRAVKSKRDYLRKGNHFSWLYLSRLAAIKEFRFMKALGEHRLPVPEAIDQNRHAVLMQMVEGDQLAQVRALDDPGPVFEEMVQIMCDMVRVGLIHCDFNEFNVIITPTNTLVAIDFPQMVSVSHVNAQGLFERDLNCILRFFEKKMGYHVPPDVLPRWGDLLQQVVKADAVDVELHASGFNHDAGNALSEAPDLHGYKIGLAKEGADDSSTDKSADDAATSDNTSSSYGGSDTAPCTGEPSTDIQGLCILHDALPDPMLARVGAAQCASADTSPTDVCEPSLCTSDGKHQHAAAAPPNSEIACNDAGHTSTADDVQQTGRGINAATSQQAALAELHRKAKAQTRRQSQVKASRNSVKEKGRKKHAAQSMLL